MKQYLLSLFICSSIGIPAQCSLFSPPSEVLEINNSDLSYSELNQNSFSIHRDNFIVQDYLIDLNAQEMCLPKTPVLTTLPENLEVCEGNSATLTAISNYPIEWYASYPPEGEPIAKGNIFVTPALSTGYYIYHALANNNGIKSESSEMEVVMVYPLPFISIVNSSSTICAGETATLSAFGTRSYLWSNGEKTNEIIIQPKQSTDYSVIGINTAGCKRRVDYTQIVESCEAVSFNSLSLNSTDNNVGFKSNVFPNPNRGEFNVWINSISEFTRIELYNSFGELVLDVKATQEQTKLSIDNPNKGIYTLRILDQNKLIKQEKVLIEN